WMRWRRCWQKEKVCGLDIKGANRSKHCGSAAEKRGASFNLQIARKSSDDNQAINSSRKHGAANGGATALPSTPSGETFRPWIAAIPWHHDQSTTSEVTTGSLQARGSARLTQA